MRLAEISARIAVVETEMRDLYDAAEQRGEDLSGESLESWNALSAELDELRIKEQRARRRDELDRRAAGRPVESRAPEGDVSPLGLRPEQRCADYVRQTSGVDCSGLSVGRLVAGMVTGRWSDAEREQRTMGSTSGAAGGFLVPTPVAANVIDLARNASVLIRAGVGTIPMSSNTLTIPQVLSDPQPSWRGEGQAIDERDGTFGAQNLTARSLAVLVRVNAELLDDVPTFASILDNQLASSMALALDRAGLYGNGVGQPLGLRNNSLVNETSMGANGATPTDYDDFLDLLLSLREANGNPTTLVYAPRTANTLAKIVTGIASDKTKLTQPADFAALAKLQSNQISIAETQGSSNAASTAFLGGFENCAFAIRQDLTIEASRLTAFSTNQVLVRAILRADFACYRPAQLARLIGILAS